MVGLRIHAGEGGFPRGEVPKPGFRHHRPGGLIGVPKEPEVPDCV